MEEPTLTDQDFALKSFREKFGAEWYMFLNSPLWRAARALLVGFGPNTKLAGIPPLEVIQFGVVFAANIQGFQDALQTMEKLMVPGGAEIDPTYQPSYSPDFDPVNFDRPPPAPLAPPLPVEKPKHRKSVAKPQPKKK